MIDCILAANYVIYAPDPGHHGGNGAAASPVRLIEQSKKRRHVLTSLGLTPQPCPKVQDLTLMSTLGLDAMQQNTMLSRCPRLGGVCLNNKSGGDNKISE